MAVIASIAGVAPTSIAKIAGMSDPNIYKIVTNQYPIVTPTSCVGWWRLDEGTGTSIADLMGNMAAGTCTDAWTAGKVRAALTFDGSLGAGASIPDPGTGSVLDFANGDSITICCWGLIDDDTRTCMFVHKNAHSGGNPNWSLDVEGNRLNITWNDTVAGWQVYRQNLSGEYLAEATWYHLAVTYTFGTGASAKLYKNGVLVRGYWSAGNGNATNPRISNDVMSLGGKLGGGFPLYGDIDDVRVYRRILTVDELLKLAAA
jgi:hypothetical protein